MVFFLAPLVGALGAAGTATVAAAGLGAAASIYASNQQKKAQNAANAQAAAANAFNMETFQISRDDVARQRAEDRAWQIEDRDWAMENSGINFAKLRDDALAAGFNPSSALGHAGAYAGAPAAMGAMRGQPTVVGAPDYVMPQIGVSSSSFIGDALSSTASVLRDYASAITDRETQIAVVREEHSAKMQQLKTASTAYQGAGYSIPKAVAAAGTTVSEPPKVPGVKYDNDPSLGIRIGGSHITPDAGTSNTDQVEKRYGDWVSGLYGIGVAASDAATSVARSWRNSVVGNKIVKPMNGYKAFELPPLRAQRSTMWGDYRGHSSGRVR